MEPLRRVARCLFLLALLVGGPGSAAAEDCQIEGTEPVLLDSGSGVGGTGRGDDSGIGVGDDSGIGGTGHGDDSGIGGTGHGDDSGIGGTGHGEDSGIGGTGIFGTVSGVGELCVNGLRVRVGPGAEVTIRGLPASAEQLALGQVVWIEATQREGALHAERVEAFSVALGEIERVEAGGRRIRVAGRWIEVRPGTRLVERGSGAPLPLTALERGRIVEVSGLPRAGGSLEASRIERGAPELVGLLGLPELPELMARAPRISRLSAEGHVFARPEGNRLRVDGLVVELPERPDAPERLRPDTRVFISGRVTPSRVLRAERVDVRPTRPEKPDIQRPVPLPIQPGLNDKPAPAPRPPEVPKPPERPELPERPGVPERPVPIERPEVIERPQRPNTTLDVVR